MSDNEQTNPDVVMRYRGNRTMRIPGVPRRDLTKADVDRLQPEVLREAMASSLYEIVSGAHLPLNRSAIEEPPAAVEPIGDVTPPEVPPPPTGDESGGAPDVTGETGRKRRNAGGGA